MTESEFNELSDAVFLRIEQAIDAGSGDVECCRNGAVLELEFDDGSQIIINRHAPSREIWLAAKSGGFHHAWKDGNWVGTRDGVSLFDRLAELVRQATGESPIF